MQINDFLAQVREQRHFDLDAVAEFTSISASRLSDFEAGRRVPSYLQLEKLADVYGLPAYFAASPSLPNLEEALPDFRRREPRPAILSPAAMKKIWATQEISHLTFQLATAVQFSAPAWATGAAIKILTRASAERLRSTFDEWFGRRRRRLNFIGTDEQVFLAGFRLFIEVQGTLVNINQAPASDYLGFFSYSPHTVPTIFVNRSISSKKAQLFTLAHEFAHKVTLSSGVSNPFVVKNSVERAANRFAADFLAPMEVFGRLVEGQPKSTISSPSSLIVAASRGSLLSLHAAAIRLAEGGYISQAQLGAWVRGRGQLSTSEKEEESEAAGEARGAPHAKRVGELGYISTYLAKLAVEERIIDAVDVSAGMHLSETLQQRAFTLAARRIEAAY